LLFGGGGFYKPDQRLGGFALTEEEFAFPIGIVPVLKELAGNRRHARVSLLTPCFHPFPDGVYQIQRDELFLEQGRLWPARARLKVVARRTATLSEYWLTFFVSPVTRGLVEG
jgi:hypothetical protein